MVYDNYRLKPNYKRTKMMLKNECIEFLNVNKLISNIAQKNILIKVNLILRMIKLKIIINLNY